MDIHKPKAFHSWREFVSEIAIIVIGVLIALGAEQVVSHLHERQMSREAREAIRRELQFNIARLNLRRETSPCVQRRLDELQALLDRGPGRMDPPKWVGRPQFWTLQASRWQAANQAGRAVLLPAQELGAYGLMHAQMENLTGEMVDEQTQWARLRALAHVRELTPQAALDLNQALQIARYRNWGINLQTGQIRHLADVLGLKPVTVQDAASRSVCVPMDTPPAEAQRLSRFPSGEL